MKKLFNVINFVFIIIYSILNIFQESLGCPKVTSLKFEPEPPVPVGKQVKMTVDGIDTAGYEDIKLESWSVDGTKLEVTWIGMGTTATYTFTNTGEKKISIQLSGEDKDKDGKRDMREPYETTIVVYKVAKVTGSPVVIQKDGEKNITVTAILEPECEGLVEWQRKRDNGRWEPLEVVGKTVTLLSTEDVGKYKYRARAKGSDKDEDWVESENLYVVELKILRTSGMANYGTMADGVGNVDFKIFGEPSSLKASKYDWYSDAEIEGYKCDFSPQNSQTTYAKGDWYAFPIDEHTYRNEKQRYAKYKIKCKVTFTDNEIEAKEATLLVDCDPKGGVSGSTECSIEGEPDIRQIDKKWRVTGKGRLFRNVTKPEDAVFIRGVFYPKIFNHEIVHYNQYTGEVKKKHDLSQTGANYLSVDNYYNKIKELTADTKKGLYDKIKEAYQQFILDENDRMTKAGHTWGLYGTIEAEAYDSSDRFDPQYYWQLHWPWP
jgi:hypothetical protein